MVIRIVQIGGKQLIFYNQLLCKIYHLMYRSIFKMLKNVIVACEIILA